jgi:putative two-component system response regulator
MHVSIHKRWLVVALICCSQLILLLGVGAIAMRGIDVQIGLASALALTLLTVTVSIVILRGYDNRLEQINRRLEHKVYDRSTALMKTRNAVIFGLAKLAESRDNDTGKHLERIRKYVVLLGRELTRQYRLSDQFVEDLAFASSLHDIGKVGIPDSILLKPGSLTRDERQIIETHATIGGRCLEAIQRRLGNDDFLEMAKVIAYAHHERWDGEGYPFGIAEDNIPVAARIVAVADVYDALTTKRPYKRAFPHKEAYTMIVSGSASQFDPEVVKAFMAREADFSRIAEELSDSGEAVAETPDSTPVNLINQGPDVPVPSAIV